MKFKTENLKTAFSKLIDVRFSGEKTANIIDKVKTFEDACKIDKVNLNNISTDGLSVDLKAVIAFQKLCIICRVLNEGWQPDWCNSNEYKYEPCFKQTGSGLSLNDYDLWNAYSDGSSRLVFKSRELAEYAGKQFLPLYNDFIN